VNAGRWEPDTFRIFNRHIGANTVMFDIGAWVGSTALYAAQIAESTVAFEPDPISFSALQQNYHANASAPWLRRLHIFNKAVNSDGAPIVLGSRAKGGDSMSSALFADHETKWTVEAISIADAIATYARPDQPIFLKIDIEGGEYSLLPAMQSILTDKRVTAVIAMHPRFLRKTLKEKYLDQWFEHYRRAHQEVLSALPRNRNVSFGKMKIRSWLGLKARFSLTGSLSSQILIS
jgi:FkbM family methyltransferase